jgi:hypothetical protein
MLEFDIRRQMVHFILGPSFDLARLYKHRVRRDQAHRRGRVTGADGAIKGVDDFRDVRLSWWRWRRRTRRQADQESGHSVAAHSSDRFWWQHRA